MQHWTFNNVLLVIAYDHFGRYRCQCYDISQEIGSESHSSVQVTKFSHRRTEITY